MSINTSPVDIVHAVEVVGDLARSGQPAVDVSVALAQSLGWPAATLRSRDIEVGQTRVSVSRGYFGVQPAAIFASPAHRNGYDPVDGAALYAYHAGVRWGAMADVSGITVFNSHWTLQDEWFRLPAIRWDALNKERETLEALRPENVADGTLDRVALADGSQPKLLQPVDDELGSGLIDPEDDGSCDADG